MGRLSEYSPDEAARIRGTARPGTSADEAVQPRVSEQLAAALKRIAKLPNRANRKLLEQAVRAALLPELLREHAADLEAQLAESQADNARLREEVDGLRRLATDGRTGGRMP